MSFNDYPFHCTNCSFAGILIAIEAHYRQFPEHRAYQTKDSGQRQTFATGMVRDIQTNKPRYDLVDWPMIRRWAELMQRGALKYGEHNWKKAETKEEFERFSASALRHMVQWFNGDSDEDHAAACYFNIA